MGISTQTEGTTGRQHSELECGESVDWLLGAAPRVLRRLLGSEDGSAPLGDLPLTQLRLAQALYPGEKPDAEADAGETMSRLSKRLGMRQNALTQAADRLVARGMAERAADMVDRRIVRLRLTAEGKLRIRERVRERRARIAAVWSSLSGDQRFRLLEAVRTLEELTEQPFLRGTAGAHRID